MSDFGNQYLSRKVIAYQLLILLSFFVAFDPLNLSDFCTEPVFGIFLFSIIRETFAFRLVSVHFVSDERFGVLLYPRAYTRFNI